MKADRQLFILFLLLIVMIVGTYLHSLASNDWKQAPVPHRFESHEQYMERVDTSTDSVMRPYVDSVDMKMKFRVEPITEIENP